MGKNGKRIILMVIMGLIITLSVATYAYYIGSTNNDKAQTANVSTGTMNLTFADNDNGFGGAIEFGQTITKKFTIQNTGTLDASALIEWKNLANTYLAGSLIYTLEYSETENGTYTKIIEDRKVPQAAIAKTEILASKITVPTKKKYYYNLKITLVDSPTVDQTSDLSASFYTQFNLVGLNENTNAEDTLAALNLTAKTDDVDFAALSPFIIATDTGFTGNVITKDMTTIKDNYLTYADSYNFNKKSGKYTLVNPKVAKYSDVYSTLEGKYVIVPSTASNINNSNLYKTSNIVKIYKVTSGTTIDTFKYISSTRSIKVVEEGDYVGDYIFDESDAGIYSISDDYGTSYYFRGAVENNYVKFGKWGKWYKGFQNSTTTNYFKYYETLEECQNASYYNVNCTSMEGTDMYWRIIRINGDGSVRLFYSGTQFYENGYGYDNSNLDEILTELPYNEVENISNVTQAHVGYMYGALGEVSYNEAHNNTNNSTVKSYLDKWYKGNFVDNDYHQYVSDEIFCNDRSMNTGLNLSFGYYSGYERVNNYTPTLNCPQKNDAFTVNDIVRGNGNLTYPVGLITVDELLVAGFSKDSYSNDGRFNNYLGKSRSYWTMTPMSSGKDIARMYISKQSLSNMEPRYDYFGIVPVINLSPETAKTLIGTGSITDPYRLNEA